MRPSLLQRKMDYDADLQYNIFVDPNKPEIQITSELYGMFAFAKWQDAMICEGGWKIEWVNVWAMDRLLPEIAHFKEPKGSCLVTKYRHVPSRKIRWFFLEQTGRLVGYEAERGKEWNLFEDTDGPHLTIIRIG